jgi:hypothetical protein
MNDTFKTHPLNVSYLVVGLVFLGIAGSWALRASNVVDTDDAHWLLPAVLVAAGAIGIVAFAAKGISRGRQEPTVQESPAYDPFGPYDTGETTEQTSHLAAEEPGDDAAKDTSDDEGDRR